MPSYADVRPAGLDLAFRPGNTVTVSLNWSPPGILAGRTFSATLAGVALTTPVSVIGDVMTVVVTDGETDALELGVPVEFVLLESIGGTPEPIIVGRWSPSDRAKAVTSTTLEVTQGAATVAVTVAGIAASTGDFAVAGRLAVADDLAIDAFFAFDDPPFAVGLGATFTVTAGSAYQGVVFAPTIVYDAPSPFTGGRSFEDSSTLKNLAGVAKTLPHQTGFYAATLVRGDGALFTTARTAFLDPGNHDTINGGTVSAVHKSFQSTAAVGAGVTITSRRGLEVNDAAGAGTVTEQIAVDITSLTKAALNIGVRNASTYVAVPSAQTLSGAGQAIAATAEVKELTNSTGGSLTLTSAPTIANGQDGQELELANVGAQDIVLQDQGTLANSNLRLVAATITLTPRDSVRLRYSAAVGDWRQCAPVVAVL